MYQISTSDIVRFRDQLWSVRKHYAGTHRVTLVPVRTTEGGRVFIEDGKPHVFKETTVEQEASLHQSFEYQQHRP